MLMEQGVGLQCSMIMIRNPRNLRAGRRHRRDAAEQLHCARPALGSALLDLRPAESFLNVGQRRVPIH